MPTSFTLTPCVLALASLLSAHAPSRDAERELVGRLRVLARGLPQPQWEALAEGLCAAGRLRARLVELQRYRAMGMRTFAEVERYDAVEAKGKKGAPVGRGSGSGAGALRSAGVRRWSSVVADPSVVEPCRPVALPWCRAPEGDSGE